MAVYSVSEKELRDAGFSPSRAKNLASKINSLHTSIRKRYAETVKDFKRKHGAAGYDIDINQAHRTAAEQRRIQKTGVKAASPNNTWHTVGGAGDFTVFKDGVADPGTSSKNAYDTLLKPIANANGLNNPISNDVGHFQPVEFTKARRGASVESFITGGAGPVPPAEVGFGARTIKPGYKGDDVRQLQSMLKSMGADIKVDGIYGPRTRAAVEMFQKANGLKVDGIVGARTRPMLEAAAQPTNAPGVSLEARDEARAAQLAAMQGSLARYNAVMGAPKVERPAPLQAAPTIPVERRPLPDIPRALTGTTYSDPGASASTNMRLSPVAPPSVTGTTYSDPGASAQTSMRLAPVRSLASVADNRAPPGIGMAGGPYDYGPDGIVIDGRHYKSGAPTWSQAGTPVAPSANRASTATANSPFAEPSYTGRGLPPGAQASPQQVADAKRRLGLELAANAPRQLARPADNAAPPHIGMETPSQADARIARNGLTPAAVAASYARQAHQRSLVTAADNNAPPGIGRAPVASAAAATARPVDQDAMRRTFDIMSNYQPTRSSPANAAINPAAPKPLSALPSRDVGWAPGTVFSAPKRVLTAPTPAGPVAAAAARFAGVQAQQAAPPAPTYTPTAPIPRVNPLVAPAPTAAAATAVPAMPTPVPPQFMKVPPAAKLAMGLAIPGIGLGISALNRIMGAGFRQSTAAQNARVTAGVQASDLIGGAYGNASYGRRQSDGSVTGTTRSGTGWTSRDGGREISVGGRTYTKNKDRAGYSQKIG